MTIQYEFPFTLDGIIYAHNKRIRDDITDHANRFLQLQPGFAHQVYTKSGKVTNGFMLRYLKYRTHNPLPLINPPYTPVEYQNAEVLQKWYVPLHKRGTKHHGTTDNYRP